MKFPHIILFLTILLLTTLLSVHAKLSKGTANMNSETTTEVLLGSFSFSSQLDDCTINGKLTFPPGGLSYYRDRSHPLTITIFDDNSWAKYNTQIKKGSVCRERINIPGLTNYRLQLPRTSDEMLFTHTIHQSPTVLNSYVVLSDCALEDYPASPPAIHYEVTFRNGDNHLPQDEIHMPQLLLVALVPMALALAFYGYNMKKQHSRSLGQVHLVQVLVGAAFGLVLVSICAQLLHLWQYSHDGMGLKLRYTWLALDFLSEITQVMSELIIAFIFISIALFGWLFNASKMSHVLKRRHFPFFAAYVGLQLYLQYHSRKHESDFNYYFYDMSHWAGFAIIASRVFSLFLFVIGIAISTSLISSFIRLFPAIAKPLIKAELMTANQIQAASDGEKVGLLGQDQNRQLNTIFLHLTAIALLWFLAMPTAISFSLILFNPSNRRLFVVSISLFVHLATLLWFLFSFTTESSSLFKASALAHMGTIFASANNTTGKIALD